jgi:hypothetical protein
MIARLTDLSLSFEPEPGYQDFAVSPGGETESLRSLLHARVGDLGEIFESIASGSGADSVSARELLRALREDS